MRPYFLFSFIGLIIYGTVKSFSSFGWIICPSYTLQILLFLLLVHVAVYKNIVRFSKDHMGLTNLYLLGILFKLLLGFAFLIFVIYRDRQNAEGNSVLFLIAYIVFTAIEIAQLLKFKNNLK